MSFSSSDSSSLDDRCSSSSGNSSGQSSISYVLSSNVDSLMIALVAPQASQGNVGAGSSRNSYGLGYTSLRVESLGVRRLA